jgi:flagellar biosynthesis/type III secretory pathway M-ring protein FliF/YscJ
LANLNEHSLFNHTARIERKPVREGQVTYMQVRLMQAPARWVLRVPHPLERSVTRGTREEVRMSTIVIIAIVVAVVIVLALVPVYVRRRAERRRVLRERLASEATGHRQEADAHASRAQELGPEADALRRVATEQGARAEREAARAGELGARAAQVEQQISHEGLSAARHDEKAAELEEEL